MTAFVNYFRVPDMKKTEADRTFALKFAEALQPHVLREQNEHKKSLGEIAKKLGVTAPGLRKQLSGGTPSLRTVAYAYAEYGVAVDYDGVKVAKAIGPKRRTKRGRVSERQLSFPFEITAQPPSTRLTLQIVPKSVRKYRLQITIGMAG